MTSVSQDILYEIAEDANLDDSALRFDYSGRGMYGAVCFGIVGSVSDFTRFVACAADRLEPNVIADVSVDSMGLDSIFYWRNIDVEEGS